MVFIQNNILNGPEERPIPAHLSYGQFLFDQFKKGGNKTAQICVETDSHVTYNSILQSSVNLAVALQRLGLKKGDVVSLSSENRSEFTVASLGIIFSGGVISTLNVTYSPGEITHILNITKPKFIFTSPFTAQKMYECSKNMPHVEKLFLFGENNIDPGVFHSYNNLVKIHQDMDAFTLVDVNGAEDTVAVMCSSGTTGLPKGVMLTHKNFLILSAHMKYYLETCQEQHEETVRRALSLIPWFHAYGFITTFAIMCMHIEVVFLTRFEEEQYLATIQKYKINMTTIVPHLALFFAKHPTVSKYDLSSLKEVWCGAAPLSKEIQIDASKKIGIDFIRQGYGLTEMTMACCVDLTRHGKIGTCGTPAPGMKIKVKHVTTGQQLGINQVGELWIKSPLRMKGYMGNPEASNALFDADGYLQTGDMGRFDTEGFVSIVDRCKELIKYKGFQVAPAEIEALILRHQGVAECGVVGRSDERAGEVPVAFVALSPHFQNEITAQDIQSFVASKLSPANHLRGGVIFVEEIPKNSSGKILRRELRNMVGEKVHCKL